MNELLNASETGKSADTVELTVLMPCLNEAETLAICIEKAQDCIKRLGIVGEVLIADNGSTDGSIEIAQNLGARVVPVPERGYGAALLGGIEAAHGTYVIMGDADDSYDFSQLDSFIAELRKGSDLVMGNRFKGGISEGAMPFLHRYLGNPVLSFIGRLLFGIRTGDFHCGMRGFNRKAISELKLNTTGMEFASEMVVQSALQNLTMAEVPTTLRPDGRSRPPHLRTWRDGWRHLKFLLMHSPKWLFIYPGLTLTFIGLLLAALLIAGPVSLAEGLEIDLNTFLVGCLTTIIGTQILTFGLIARAFASTNGLLPVGGRSQWLQKWCTTENVALLALALLIAGSATFGWAFVQWLEVGFGNVTDPLVPRFTAAGLSMIAIAIQTGFAAFLFGIIELPQRKPIYRN